jgi:hypothetical protein
MRRDFLFLTLVTMIGAISLFQRVGERIVGGRKFHSQLRENGDGDVHCRPVWMACFNEGEDVVDVMRMRNGEVKCQGG